MGTSTTTPSSCPREEEIEACVAQGGVFQCEHCTDGVSNGPCCACHGGESSSATTTTTSATTTTLESGSCKSWCAENTKPWSKKCKWSACADCFDCSSRRLRGSAFLPGVFV